MKKILFLIFIFFSSYSFSQVPPTDIKEYVPNSAYICGTGTCQNKGSGCTSTRAGHTNAFYCTSPTGFYMRTQCPNTVNSQNFIKLKYANASDANQRCTYGSCPAGLTLKADKSCGCPQVG